MFICVLLQYNRQNICIYIDSIKKTHCINTELIFFHKNRFDYFVNLFTIQGTNEYIYKINLIKRKRKKKKRIPLNHTFCHK